MGLSWQQGPLGRNPNAQFLVPGMPERILFVEPGFAARWYVPRDDVVAEALTAADLQTFCPYKGVASSYDIDGIRHAAWSYRAPFDAWRRSATWSPSSPIAWRSRSRASASSPSRGRRSSRTASTAT
jgi:hypothetical protein